MSKNVFVAVRPELLDSILSVLEESSTFEIAGTATTGEECIVGLMETSVDVALIDFSLPQISGVKVVEFLSSSRPSVISVLVSEKANHEFYRSGMLAGAREFVILPTSAQELDFVLERVVQIAGASNTARQSLTPRMTAQVREGRVLVLTGGKGGTGVSFIAANLAQLIAARDPEFQIALVDFDLQAADLATILNVKPQKTIKDIEPVISELEPSLLKSIAHKMVNNLDLYAGRETIEASDLFTGEQTGLLVDCFRRSYDLTIVDNGSCMREANNAFFEVSDLILLMLSADVLSIKAAKRLVDYLESIGISKNSILAVMNRWEKLFLPAERVSHHIGVQTAGQLPESSAAVLLLEEGRVLTPTDESDLKFAFDELIVSVCEKLSILENLSVS